MRVGVSERTCSEFQRHVVSGLQVQNTRRMHAERRGCRRWYERRARESITELLLLRRVRKEALSVDTISPIEEGVREFVRHPESQSVPCESGAEFRLHGLPAARGLGVDNKREALPPWNKQRFKSTLGRS